MRQIREIARAEAEEEKEESMTAEKMPEIEQGIPMPDAKPPRKSRRAFVSPWLGLLMRMEVGDSVRIPSFRVQCVRSNAKRLGYRVVDRSDGRMEDPNDWRQHRADIKPQVYNATRVWLLSKG